MSDVPRILCREHPGIPPEQARDARARAWTFAFRCWQEKSAKQAPNSGDYKTLANEKRRLT
jgi:hypothetical protein